jgi:hypothetical protein
MKKCCKWWENVNYGNVKAVFYCMYCLSACFLHTYTSTPLSSLACWCLGYGLSFLYLDVALWSLFFHAFISSPAPCQPHRCQIASPADTTVFVYESTNYKRGHEYATKLSFYTNCQAVWSSTNMVSLSGVSNLRTLDWPIFFCYFSVLF